MEKKTSKSSRLIRAGLAVFTVILVILIFGVIHVVSGIQGTARVVNYAGLVRGGTQRMVKMEIAGEPQDKLIETIQSYIDGLRKGSKELDFVRLDDREFQDKMQELDIYFQKLKKEIYLVREKGYQNTEIISKSEKFFGICDEAVGLSEIYSQKRATALEKLERLIVLDVFCLILLTVIELIKAIRYAALNRALQKKVYLDEATGLPNKNKCEELLSDFSLLEESIGVCVFDLNNLRIINNSMGHEMGDEYIRRFAVLLRESVPEEYFVGRAGGDEFIAIMKNQSHEQMQEILKRLRAHVWKYSEDHTDIPISYAAGYALSEDQEDCTMRTLFAEADKSMYINKNHMKLEEAALIREQDQKLLRRVNVLGKPFSDCLYCDAKRDTYRTIRRSDNFFLAKEGNYSGAVEQITEEQVTEEDRSNVGFMIRKETLNEILSQDNPVVEVQYQYQGKDTVYGRITVIYVDQDEEENLHHFLLAFENIHCGYDTADAKQQLMLFYEQMKQSILENSNYVDALLETATTVYSVNITEDRVEQNFIRREEKSPQVSLGELGLELPCSYDEYCRRRTDQIARETLESYRLTDTSAKLQKRFETGEKQITVEYRERNADGSYRWVQKTILMSESIVYDRDSDSEKKVIYGMVLLKNTTDLHQREQQEMERLKAAFQEAETANKAKTAFLSRMSHDIRTPINGVMGMLQIISKNRDDHEKVDDCLEKIQISAEHLLALINDVLDMSKLEAGKVELDHIPFNLTDVLKVAYALNDAQISLGGITFISHPYELPHTEVIGSPLHLRQILLNLFNNAMKYNRPSGTIDTYTRELSFDGQKTVIEFKIVDTGIGMSEEFVKKELFTPFTQEKIDEARTEYKGTGLGMAIVKELVEKMGGTIQAESVLGKGSTFTVVIPFEIDRIPEQHVPFGASEQIQAEDLKGTRILLVEDNELNMEIAEFMLEDGGAVILKAWNGKEAVEIFEKSEPGEIDLIMMDIMMPVMDGLEATRRIRKLNRADAATIPIVAMTANAFSDDIRRSREAGMNEHLSKPLEMEKIIRTAARYCGKR